MIMINYQENQRIIILDLSQKAINNLEFKVNLKKNFFWEINCLIYLFYLLLARAIIKTSK